jgi:hypothetical protein
LPSSNGAWHITLSKWMRYEGFNTVGFEKSMWYKEEDGECLMVGAHIDDFLVGCTSQATIHAF